MLRITASLVLAACLLSSAAAASEIAVSQSLDRPEMAFEDSVVFEIQLRWDGSQAAYLFEKPLMPTLNRLALRGFTSSVSTIGEGDLQSTTKVYRFTLAPVASGLGTIEPVTIPYLAWPDSVPGSLVTEGMSVRIAQPRPAAERRISPFLWVVLGLVVTGGALGVGLLVRSRKARRMEAPDKTPAEQFLEELTTLRDSAGDDLKKFLHGLCRIMEDYFSARFGVTASKLSDEDVGKALAGGPLPPAASARLTEWYCRARRDKYRPLQPSPGEAIRLESEIRELFERIRSSQ